MKKLSRKRIFEIIQIGQKNDMESRVFDFVIVSTIFLNICALFLETFRALDCYNIVFKWIEIVTVAIFCVEYIARIWTADFLYPGLSKKKAIMRFLISFDGIVDFFTIVPAFFLSGFVAFRMLRVVRILHLFRINPKVDSFNVIKEVLYDKRNQIASSIFIVLVLMLASSLGVYSAECKVQPDVFENAFSGIWWSVSTLLTVGYGDIYPITTLGKVMAILTAFCGVGVVAIPTGIISAGFVEHYTKKQNSDVKYMDVAEIGEIKITSGHNFIGMSVRDIYQIHHCHIYMIIREQMTILATENFIVQEGDLVIVQSVQLQKRSTGL